MNGYNKYDTPDNSYGHKISPAGSDQSEIVATAD